MIYGLSMKSQVLAKPSRKCNYCVNYSRYNQYLYGIDPYLKYIHLSLCMLFISHHTHPRNNYVHRLVANPFNPEIIQKANPQNTRILIVMASIIIPIINSD